jgi:hypothetical protein
LCGTGQAGGCGLVALMGPSMVHRKHGKSFQIFQRIKVYTTQSRQWSQTGTLPDAHHLMYAAGTQWL